MCRHAETQYDKMQVEYAELRKLNTEQTDFTETELKLRIYRSLGMAILDELPTDLSTDKEDPEAASIPVRVRLRKSLTLLLYWLPIDRLSLTLLLHRLTQQERCAFNDHRRKEIHQLLLLELHMGGDVHQQLTYLALYYLAINTTGLAWL